MIYEIIQLRMTEAELVDVSAQTDHEVLPSGRFVLIRDIKKSMNGEDFNIFPPEGGKPIKIKGIAVETWASYFTLFNRCQKFGLPHGKGWLNELPWVIDFLDFMKDTLLLIEHWQNSKSPGQSEITPGEVGI